MTLEMSYSSIFTVIDSWERLRRVPDYEKVAGTVLFQHLFKKCPQAKALFGFPIDTEINSNKLLKSKRFLMHATYMIQMLDKALNLLGPDIELLAEILTDLGKKHARYGVKEEYFKFMGESLLETLETVLGKNGFNEEEKICWTEVYDALSTEMCKGLNKEQVVIKSWDQLKSIENYEEVAGILLFQSFFAKCPSAMGLFGFPATMDPQSQVMINSRRFKMHSSYFIEMLDRALNMMEKEKLDENLTNLGKLHVNYGVQPEYFPLMGEALIDTLRQMLKIDFNTEVEQAWSEVYGTLSTKMIKAMVLAQK